MTCDICHEESGDLPLHKHCEEAVLAELVGIKRDAMLKHFKDQRQWNRFSLKDGVRVVY